MNNKTLLIIALFACLFANAQTERKIYYNSDEKVVYNKDSATFYRMVKLDAKNKALDTIRDYYMTGELKCKTDGALYLDTVNNDSSKFTGSSRGYYKSGKRKALDVRDSKSVCLTSEGWYEDGKPRYVIPYVAGKREGDGKWVYETGAVLSVKHYTNDKETGVSISYFENGKPYSEVTYADGKKNGPAKNYFETGELNNESAYVNDTITGTTKYYYKNGKLQSELPHSHGKINGLYKAYYESGELRLSYDYVNGLVDGYVTLYCENKNLERKDKYEKNKFVSGNCYDMNGKEVKHDEYFLESPSDQVYTVVQKMPTFPGNLNEYLSQHIKYPKKEQKNNVTGTVYVNFVIEKDGSVSNVKILKGVPGGQGLDMEAFRVVSSLPKWAPGMQNGQAVRVSFNIPIRFTLI